MRNRQNGELFRKIEIHSCDVQLYSVVCENWHPYVCPDTDSEKQSRFMTQKLCPAQLKQEISVTEIFEANSRK